MGYHDESVSYIHFLILKLTGMYFDPERVDNFTITIFILCLVISVYLNIHDYRKNLKNR